jgi:hypothetical protein
LINRVGDPARQCFITGNARDGDHFPFAWAGMFLARLAIGKQRLSATAAGHDCSGGSGPAVPI